MLQPAHHGAISDVLAAHLTDGGPGIVAAVAQHGRLLFREAFGLAHVELGVPMAIDKPLPIASISKQFTAMAALLCAADGLLDIDTPIGHYLPELSPLQGAPTLRQLMTHQSGLHCHLDIAPLLTELGAIRRDDFCLTLMSALTTVNAAPGAWQCYGNSGFNLLAVAIERASGKPFEQVVSDRIFTPLGMGSTRYFKGASRLRAGVASLYVREEAPGGDGDGWINTSDIRTDNAGEGGIHSTIDDLMIWASALRCNDPRLPASCWAALKTPALLGDGTPSCYGLGLALSCWRGLDLAGHGGDLFGLSSILLTVPDHGIDLVIIGNMPLPIETVARRILAAVIGEDRLAAAPQAAPTHDYQALDGAVFEATNMLVRFRDMGGGLGCSVQGSPFLPVMLDNSGALAIQSALGPVRLDLSGEGLRITMGGETHDCRRAPPAPASAPADATGDYRRPDTGTRITVERAGDGLVARYPERFGLAASPMTPIAPDAFLFANALAGNYVARLIRDGSGTVTGLRFDTTRTRNLLFDKMASAGV